MTESLRPVPANGTLRKIAENVPQGEPELGMFAGAGWPESLVAAFGLDIPEEERGVWWPLTSDGEFVAFCNDPQLQTRLAGAAYAAPVLAEGLLAALDENEWLREDILLLARRVESWAVDYSEGRLDASMALPAVVREVHEFARDVLKSPVPKETVGGGDLVGD